MSKFLWNIQAGFYRALRRNPVSAGILRQENEAVSFLLKEFLPAPVQRGLDIGSGSGNSLKLIPSGEAGWISLDYSLRMIRKSRPHFKHINFVAGDASSLPFKTESFDLVLCIGVAEYFPDIDPFLQGLNQIEEVDGMTRALDICQVLGKVCRRYCCPSRVYGWIVDPMVHQDDRHWPKLPFHSAQ